MNQLDRIERKLDQIIKLMGASFTTVDDVVANPAERYGCIAGQAWCQALLLGHCKVNRNNWTVWKSMHDQYGDKLTGLAQMLEADRRWPDQVQKYIERTSRKATSVQRLKDHLAACGCNTSDNAFDAWKLALNRNCNSVDGALECVTWITEQAKRAGKPVVWPTDATPWIESWRNQK